MNEYTTEDFANAEFAKHPIEATIAARNGSTDYPWQYEEGCYASDSWMAADGWAPVSSTPTITESQLAEAFGDKRAWAKRRLRRIDIQTVPDAPELTDGEKIERLIEEWMTTQDEPVFLRAGLLGDYLAKALAKDRSLLSDLSIEKCPQGHPRIPENILRSNGQHKGCKICHRERSAEWGRKKKQCPECGSEVAARRLAAHRREVHGVESGAI